MLLAGGALVATMGAALAAPASAGGSSSAHTMLIKTVKVPKIGTVLATSSGLTLYRFTADQAGKATCTGACAKEWPPLLLSKGDRLEGPHGLRGLSTIRVSHGRRQVSFDNVALYRFSGDQRKGEAKGQGVGGVWFAVLQSGIPRAATGATGGTATTSPPGATSPPAPSPSNTVSPTTSPPAPSPSSMTAPPVATTTTPASMTTTPPTTMPTSTPTAGIAF